MVAEGEFHHKEKVREVAMCSYQRFYFGKMNIYMIYITCTSSQNELGSGLSLTLFLHSHALDNPVDVVTTCSSRANTSSTSVW